MKNRNKILIPNHLYQVGRDIQPGYYMFSNQGTADAEYPTVHFNMYPEHPPVSRYRRSRGYFGVTEIDSSTRYVELEYGQALYYGKPFNLYETLKLVSLPNSDYYPEGTIMLQNEICAIKVYRQDKRTYLYHGDGDAEVYEQYLYSINGHKFWAGVLSVKSYRSYSGFALGFVDTERGQHYSFEKGCGFAGTTYSSCEVQIRLYRDNRGSFVEVELPPDIELGHTELEWIQPKSNYVLRSEPLIKSGKSIQELYSAEINNLRRDLKELYAAGIDIDAVKEIDNLSNTPDLLLICAQVIHNCLLQYPNYKDDSGDADRRFTFSVNLTYNKQYYCAAKLADVAENVQSNGEAYYVTFRGEQIREISLMCANLASSFSMGETAPWSASVAEYLYQHNFHTFLSQNIQKCLSEVQEKYGYSPAVNGSVLISILRFLRKKLTCDLDELYRTMLCERRVAVKWSSEYSLFELIKQCCPETIYQYRVDWLGQQSFDIFLPDQKTAIEYQGKQHYEAVEMFGGDTSLEDNKERDKRKRKLSAEHGVRVLDWKYDVPVNRVNVLAFLEQHGITYDDSISVTELQSGEQTHPMAPVKQKPKTKAKVSREPRPSPFAIRQFTTDGQFVAEYSSVKEASEKCDVSEKSIRKVIYGERKTGGGFVWKRYLRESKIENIAPIEYAENMGLAKRVLQLSEDGKLIAEYPSIGQAVAQTGVSARGISDVLSGRQKTAGGYVWKHL